MFFVCSDFNSPLTNKLSVANTKPKHADTVAVTYDEVNKTVTCVYADRSLYFWHLGDIKRVGKLNSFFYHSSCIWDIEVCWCFLLTYSSYTYIFDVFFRCIQCTTKMPGHYFRQAHFSPAPVMIPFAFGTPSLSRAAQQPKARLIFTRKTLSVQSC